MILVHDYSGRAGRCHRCRMTRREGYGMPCDPVGDRRGFFPNGQCRHYQLADGWAKLWCVRTDDGHTEHETSSGVRWTADVEIQPTPASPTQEENP